MHEPITDESIQAARQWFAQNALDCIFGAIQGEWYVNSLESYCEQEWKHYEAILAGQIDNTFAFAQRAYAIQTGKWVALLG